MKSISTIRTYWSVSRVRLARLAAARRSVNRQGEQIGALRRLAEVCLSELHDYHIAFHDLTKAGAETGKHFQSVLADARYFGRIADACSPVPPILKRAKAEIGQDVRTQLALRTALVLYALIASGRLIAGAAAISYGIGFRSTSWLLSGAIALAVAVWDEWELGRRITDVHSGTGEPHLFRVLATWGNPRITNEMLGDAWEVMERMRLQGASENQIRRFVLSTGFWVLVVHLKEIGWLLALLLRR